VITPFTKLAKRILWQAAKDMTPERGSIWIDSEAARSLCEQGLVDYGDFVEAMKFILTKSEIQRAILLQKLKKNIGV